MTSDNRVDNRVVIRSLVTYTTSTATATVPLAFKTLICAILLLYEYYRPHKSHGKTLMTYQPQDATVTDCVYLGKPIKWQSATCRTFAVNSVKHRAHPSAFNITKKGTESAIVQSRQSSVHNLLLGRENPSASVLCSLTGLPLHFTEL